MSERRRPTTRALLLPILVCSTILLAGGVSGALAQSPSPGPAATDVSTADCVPRRPSPIASALPALQPTPTAVATMPPATSTTVPSAVPMSSARPSPLACAEVADALGDALVATRTEAQATRIAQHTPGVVRVRQNVPFMQRQACATNDDGCIERADIYYPSHPGPWPVIVTIHGRPRFPTDMAPLARALASKGAVVFNVDYRGVRPAFTKGFPEAISDVACAIRFARQQARRYGGDRHHVVLVGHSMGGYVGAMVALAGDTFPSTKGKCLSTLRMGASLPEGFVSVAGVSAVHHDYRIDQVFFGGTYQQIPVVWKRGTLYTHIGRRVGHNHDLKVGIIFETHDPFLGVGHATHLHRALVAAGYDTDLILLDQGTTHFDILDVHRTIGQRVVKLVWHIVHESDPD